MQIEKVKKHSEFVAAARAGLRAHGRFCLMQSVPSSAGHSADSACVGFTASKKSVGNAVERNFAKRRLRAVASRVIPVYGTPGISYIFIAKKNILSCKFSELLDDAVMVMSKLRSLRRPR